MSKKWTHKVVKIQRGMDGRWFDHRAAATFASEAEARQYADEFAIEQTGVGGTRITVRTRGGRTVYAVVPTR